MSPIFVLTILSVIIFTKATSDMEKGAVVPDVIDKAPASELLVSYDSEKVTMGNILTPTQVKNQPKVSWTSEPGALYTLAMVDPDAPSRKDPKFREWQHWVVVNIPNNDIGAGKTLSEYVGAGPPEGTDLHRYVLLVYKQSGGKINPDEKMLTNRSSSGRGKFNIRGFAKKYNLGEPIAGNYFQAKFDSYVPILYKQLSGK